MVLRSPITRRGLLALLAASKAASVAPIADARSHPFDVALAELESRLREVLHRREHAGRQLDACEARFFALRPPVPEALRADGPLGVSPSPGLRRWTAADLSHLAADTEEGEVRRLACRLLPLAEAYEAEVERLQLSVGLHEAEAAQGGESDALYEIAERIAELPAGGGAGLMVKARALRQLEPDWWEGEGPETGLSQRLAAQLADAVLALGPSSRR